ISARPRTRARPRGSLGNSAGCGRVSSRYSRMASDWNSGGPPSSRTRAGTTRCGFTARYSSVCCLPLRRSIEISSACRPFSAIATRTRYVASELHRLARLELLHFVVTVVGAVRRRQLGIELAARGAQPALRDRRMRVDRALEHHFPQVRREDAEHEEQVGVGCAGGNEQLGCQRAGDLGLFLYRFRKKCEPVAQGVERNGSLPVGLAAQAKIGLQIQLGPLGSCERPLVLVALDEAVDVAYLQLYSGLLVPAVLMALEVVVEKPQLQVPAVVGVEVRPVLDAVDFEPLVFRRGAQEAFEIAARMQPLPAPVGGR